MKNKIAHPAKPPVKSRLIKRGFGLFFTNPTLFFKYLRGFLLWYMPFPASFLIARSGRKKNIDEVIFEIFPEFDRLPELKQYLFDFYELNLTEYMKKTLKTGDIVIDVGARLGYISAQAASLIGKTGQIHCFEPLPPVFPYLEKLAKNNPGYHFFLNQCALGEARGTSKIYYAGFDLSGLSSMMSGLLEPQNCDIEKVFEVPVARLDEYIQRHGLERVSFIKIDVEGFELQVLRGLQNYFKNTKLRPVIVCEVYAAYAFLRYKRNELQDYMRQWGYDAYDILRPNRRIDITKFKEGANVLWRAQ